MEEQAVEREIERDEAQKEITVLREQLKEGEKSRNTAERINREVRTNWHGFLDFFNYFNIGTIIQNNQSVFQTGVGLKSYFSNSVHKYTYRGFGINVNSFSVRFI